MVAREMIVKRQQIDKKFLLMQIERKGTKKELFKGPVVVSGDSINY